MSSITGTGGDDILNGTSGYDTIDGGGGNDWLNGLQGDDSMTGGEGDDAMWGGPGIDYMEGGNGNDTYLVGELDNLPEIIVETPSGGIDRVHSYMDGYVLDTNVENLRLVGDHSYTGTGNDLNNVITGNALNNTLYGVDGNDTLDGGLGADTLDGGNGNDTFIIDQVGDVIIDSSGTDTVVVSFNNYVLQAGMENLTLGGTANINGTGNSGDNTLTGNGGHNTLDGGDGNDTYVVGAGDVIKFDSLGIDTVQTELTYSIATRLDLENITLTGSGLVNATGNTLANVLTGNAVNNTLDGVANTDANVGDRLIGGGGDDIYIVHSSADVIIENLAEGIDTVRSSASDYTLAANVENLVLMGTTAINGTGNSLANVITGNSAVNTIDGGGGDDTLSGGAGADTMIGGAGDDTFTVDNIGDVVQESGGGGTDTVNVMISGYTLTAGQEVEKAFLLGGARSFTGNEFANIITANSGGNTIHGGDGNDTVIGGSSSDKLYGDGGDDTVTAGGGLDTLDGAAGNDTLDGGQDSDTMSGGLGDDVFVVDNLRDIVHENLGEGTDTIRTSVAYTLSANVENMEWTGSTGAGTGNELNNLMTGNSTNNTFYGMAGTDTLMGLDGNDTLDGGAGDDTLVGGLGNDTYIVDSLNDKIIETGTAPGDEGIDTIKSSIDYDISNAALFSNIENLTLTGTTAITAIGSTGDNVLTGNSANNTLIGMDGKDTLDGGAGADTMIGGTGDDIYIVDNIADVVIETGTMPSTEGIDTVMTSITYSLAAVSNVENLTLTGQNRINGTGNALDNVITGNIQVNTLTGGDGNDTYVINKGDIIIELAGTSAGTHDLAKVDFDGYKLAANVEDLTLTGTSNIGGTGTDVANIITGNDGNNVLDGVLNADTLTGDTLIGGLGNDTYIVHSLHDEVTEFAGQGIDLVKSDVDFDLNLNTATNVTTGIENLTLTTVNAIFGGGNDLNNVITGSAANNTLTGLDGNDTLDGGLGADSLIGGDGNDTYYVDNIGDVIIEASNQGNDVVMSSVSYTLSDNIEQLILTGSAAINGFGNAGDNTITGNGGINTLNGGDGNDIISGGAGNDSLLGGIGNDTIDGGIGNDTMDGGAGNDTFTVNAATDVVMGGDGNDLILSSVTYTLASDVEQLTLTGTAKINATGNDLANVLIGNTANNTLDGGVGADTMTGGAGDDLFIVDNAGDVVHEDVDQGNDTVRASVDYVLTSGSSIENLIFTGTGNITGGGNELNNTITSNMGVDALSGGLGDDVFILNSLLDTVTENADEGKDTVMIGLSGYTLSANVENLTLTGTAAINGTGNSLDNTLTGNSGLNTLDGGSGNDTYVVDTKDVIIDSSGNDTIMVAFTASLSNVLYHNIVENITLTGKGALNATGDEHANTLTGNDGNNILDGGSFDGFFGTDADTFIGGFGNDTYILHHASDIVTEAAGAGIDLVKADFNYHLTDNVENLTLLGTGDIYGIGNELNNTITGNAGNNVLDGGVGVDTLIGGAGNDTYYVDNAGDVLKDTSGLLDTVHSTVSYTLLTGFEDLVLEGLGDINGFGNTAVNVLTGNAGNNTLDGGTGADKMIGGAGNDTYIVDNLGDMVSEDGSAGIDTIMSKLSIDLRHYDNVENAVLTGTANATLHGSTNGGNYLTGNSGSNVIIAGDGGVNHLDGGAGKDTLIGGLGDDVFTFTGTDAFKAPDIIENFDPNHDVIVANNILIGFDPLLDVNDDYFHYKDYVVNGQTLGQYVYVDQDGTGTQYHDQLLATILY